MPPDDEAQNETSRSSPSRREYAFALITALLFTAVNSIGLSYIYTYYAGDIEHQVLPVVTYYLIQALSALLPYLPLAVSLRSVYIRGPSDRDPFLQFRRRLLQLRPAHFYRSDGHYQRREHPL